MKSTSRLTSSTPTVRTHTLEPTPDAPRSYNLVASRLLIKDKAKRTIDVRCNHCFASACSAKQQKKNLLVGEEATLATCFTPADGSGRVE